MEDSSRLRSKRELCLFEGAASSFHRSASGRLVPNGCPPLKPLVPEAKLPKSELFGMPSIPVSVALRQRHRCPFGGLNKQSLFGVPH